MSPRFLNIIIALSIIGIAGVLVKERFFPSSVIPASAETQVASAQESVESTPSPAPDPLVPCENTYFNFQKGSAWKYKLSVGTTFTSTVVENADSSVTISTKLPSTKEPVESTLTCKKSGVYGLPFIPITSKEIPASIMDAILFIPPDAQLTQQSQWDSTIDVGVQIPFSAGGIGIHSKVREFTDNSVTVGSSINMGTSLLPGNIQADKNGDILEYTLTKGVGVSSMTVAGVTATLTGFNPAKE